MGIDARLTRDIVDRASATLPETVALAVARTWAQVPAYPASPDPALRADLTAHVDSVFRAVLTTMAEQRPVDRTDFPITARQAGRRVRQGVSLADFLRAYRINLATLWESLVAVTADDPARREAALHLATHMMQSIEVSSSVAAEAYMQTQQLDLAERDRLRRDLMEDLLTGREPAAGPKRDVASAAGLDRSVRFVMVSAVPTTPLSGNQSLRDALTTVRQVLGAGTSGIAVVRQDEIVGVAPLSTDDLAPLVTGHERAQRRLARHGVDLAVGVSTVHTGLGAVPRAYAEAVVARDGLAGRPGVLALPGLGSFDYLMLRDDPTAARLIRPEQRRFVEEDRDRGGVLVDTLLTYVRNDLNATLTAAEMHTHVNTAYYRLERIAERTGCDLRRFTDLLELLIAVRLLTGRGADGPD